MNKQRIRNTILIYGGSLLLPAGGLFFFGMPGLLAGLGLVLVLFLAASGLFIRIVLRRPKGLLSNVGISHGTRREKQARTKAYIEEKEALLAPTGWEDVWITAQDGLRLHGLFIPAKDATETRTVVLLHGYSRRAVQMAEFALFWRQSLGVNVLIPDARAHGQSEGRYTTMSCKEKQDAALWLHWVGGRFGPGAPTALHGVSMGATTALSVAGNNPPSHLKLVMADCGFTSAWDEFSYQLRHRMLLPVFPLLHLGSLWARVRAGFWLWDASALKMMDTLRLPALFVHGEADHFVPTCMVHPLFKKANSRDKQLLLIPGAAHVQAFFAPDSHLYKETLMRMAEKYLPKNKPSSD